MKEFELERVVANLASVRESIRKSENRIHNLENDVNRILAKRDELEERVKVLEKALDPIRTCDPSNAFSTANTLANHGNVRFDNPDEVSTGIYHVCNAVAAAQNVLKKASVGERKE